MKHWRHSNPSKPPLKHQHQVGIELALEELLESKRFADNLELPTQQKVKTHLLGGFISHFKGRGMDFDEARLYQMGDDIRSIDWRVTARTGEAHTKIYREERERPVFVILDQSASMMFGSRQQFKSVLAAKLASIIMWKSLADGNRFGALIFDEFEHFENKPASTRKNCLRVLNKIVENHNQQIERLYVSPSSELPGDSGLSQTLKRTRKLARPGSLIFILSDFTQFDNDCENHLLRLSQHNEISLLQLSDPLEKDLPPSGNYTITNGKQRVAFNTQSRSFRKNFHEQFEQRASYLKNLSMKNRMRWSLVNTEDSLGQLLTNNGLSSSRGRV
ncbi:DUF58 domain-containing protein [Pleionea sediminis]|uniref:DUF58 domain-containing protein n=1 Tax=Pleionea sediminis TaxID=2569479 RepID=UPI001185330D|nr:DUF58 domain-containing protein [Pleionea sediminis]